MGKDGIDDRDECKTQFWWVSGLVGEGGLRRAVFQQRGLGPGRAQTNGGPRPIAGESLSTAFECSVAGCPTLLDVCTL